MQIAAMIAGLVQEGRALGYDVFQALMYADDRLDPALVIESAQLPGIAAELNRRMPDVEGPMWAVLVRSELGHRIVRKGAPAEGAKMPGWAVALMAFAGLMLVSSVSGGGR